jgi:O-antigen ligase
MNRSIDGKLAVNLRRLARGTVVGAVVVSPWLFGSDEPWAHLLLCLLVAVGTASWLVTLLWEPAPRIRIPLLTALLLAIAAFLVLQMLPLPPATARAVSPLSARAREEQARVSGQVGLDELLPAAAAAHAPGTTVSASPASTRHALYLLAAYAGAFLVIANTFQEWSQVRGAATAVAVSSFALVLLGLLQRLSGTRAIYWFHDPGHGGAFFGPFINRNHFAAYANTAFGVALGLLLSGMAEAGTPAAAPWRRRLAWLSTRTGVRSAMLVFAMSLTGAAVFVSLSRGGILSLVAAFGLVGAVVGARRRIAAGGRLILAVGVMVCLGVAWLGWQPVAARLSSLGRIWRDPLGDSRATAAADTLAMFRASPWVGHGFGAYAYAFPPFQSADIQFGRWVHAHNEYVQLLAEGGIAGAALVVAAAGCFVVGLLRAARRASRRGRLMLVGLSVSLLSVALHSFVDFSLRRPANGFMLAMVCGLSVACGCLRRRPSGKEEMRDEDERSSARPAAVECAAV